MRVSPPQFGLKRSTELGLAAVMLLTALPNPARGDLSSSEIITPSGRALVSIESDLYRLTFDPVRGGRCSSFLVKATGREWVYDGEVAGLFLDHFAHQYWPGELLAAPYEYEVHRGDEEAISIRLWTLLEGVDPLTRGMQVEKTITLRAGRREIEVSNGFANPTGEGKNVALWVQHCFSYGGQRLHDQYYRPSVHGISLNGKDGLGERHYPATLDEYAQDWVREPQAGWTAGRDRRTNEGAVFLMDANYLSILYNCANSWTTEWFMDKVPIPPGKSWTTHYRIVPVDGFRGFAHASPRLIANVEVTASAQEVQIAHQVSGTTDSLGKVTVDTRIYGVRSKTEVSLPALVLERVGLEPVEAQQSWSRPQTEPLVIRVEARGTDWQEQYEYLYEGEFYSAGIAGAPTIPEYTLTRAPKQKEFLKPESWARPVNPQLRVMVMFGLYTQHYRLRQALRLVDRDYQVDLFDGWDFFPATYEELLSYDLIVLSNMFAGPDYANEMIADCVEQGVGLLTLGGMHTYGSGQWRDTRLAEIVPVVFPSNFDLKWERQGVRPQPAGQHESLLIRLWPRGARFYWVHEAVPKPEAMVVMRAGDRPLVVLGQYGAGRVVTVLGTCHGEPGPEQREAWRVPEWVQLLAGLTDWLSEGEG